MNNSHIEEEQLESILNMLIEFSRGNFRIKEEVRDDDGVLNTVISGLNMLGEELNNYKNQVEAQTDFLQNILSSIDEIIYARKITDDALHLSPFTFLSGRCEEIIGYSMEDLEKQPGLWSDSIHPDDRLTFAANSQKLLKGQDAFLIYRIKHGKNQKYRWIEDRAVARKNHLGKVAYIYGSARDITEQQRNRIELEDKNEFISRLITSSDQFFYIVSITPGDSFTNNFTYVSWQIEKIQGSTVNELKNNPYGWINSIHPDDLDRLKEDNKRMFSTRQPVTRIYRTKHAHRDEYIWLEDYVVPVADEFGYIRELYGSARNINDRKLVEIEREKLITELNNRYNELMQFNYIVSHNLRAPVSHILGLAQLLNTDMSEEEKKMTEGYILEAAGSLDELMHDLNTILSTRSTLNEKRETFFLQEVIDSTCKGLTEQISNTAATIDINIAPGAEEVTTIKSYLQSAIFNLVGNAIKYRSEDKPPVIRISATKKKDRTVIVIADNGIGIDLATNGERVFGLYSRFNTTYEGKGLGLYMTKTQIESIGGTITVDSTPGIGTTFTITL